MRPGELALEQLQAIHAGGRALTWTESSRAGVRASARLVQAAADGDAPVDGVNTGFGMLANHVWSIDKSEQYGDSSNTFLQPRQIESCVPRVGTDA